MSWYLENGKDSDIVISSRIRLARNVRDFCFERKMSKDDKEKLLDKIKFVTPSIGYGLKFMYMRDMDDITKNVLFEKNLISSEMVRDRLNEGAILINDDENICIMLNTEDHIRLQVFASGLDLQNTMNLAIEIDEKLDELLGFSYNKQYGFLTACPTDVGTGLKASVIVHLPALKMTGNLGKILKIVNSFGMTIRDVYGEENRAKADVYEISNNQTLGMSEKEIVANLENITKQVIEQERLARKYLAKNTNDLEDRIYRAYGTLTNARKITSEECRDLLSDVKLGTDLGIITELNDSKVKELMLYTKPANMQKYLGKKLEPQERITKRREAIMMIIAEK